MKDMNNLTEPETTPLDALPSHRPGRRPGRPGYYSKFQCNLGDAQHAQPEFEVQPDSGKTINIVHAR
ncbi:uncharacterized protein EAF01_011077 [Botrytis porri]|uniref:Uncharacterized protein n=1 Tax=Botrytis porri TaxID=87229 RepID=A0A4Z1K6V8_9HELO|nr:uncharacterized protein EAF01_011077 [Botrytis porri]KAF7887923.1 hypothetical protein EAF01_011077 [Botrytis porri]TGO81244.1 hypothetical protein BPOR_1251g00010 [Botrytis porri]